jgi:predicted AAA+ superfamily ATPase
VDEWQEVPTVLGAVKRAVDDDPRPGRFDLTGSVPAELENETWPGTGRLGRGHCQGRVRLRRALREPLFITEQLPPWSTNRLSRLIKSPKRYVVDPALAAAALAATTSTVLNDGHLLGRIIDTFTVAQIRPQLTASRTRLFHLRTDAGRREIDLLAEQPGGGVLAVEIEASASPTRHDARHILWLRDELPDTFVAGAVLHTGPACFTLDDRVLAVSLCALWS